MVSTEPTEIQLREISEADQETPFDMINQIKYRPVAIYESEIDNALGRSGREAYQEYGKVALPKIIALGGSIVYRERMIIFLLENSPKATMSSLSFDTRLEKLILKCSIQ